jgi:putative DNA primase/helicase
MTWPAHQRSDPSPSSTDHHHGEPQRMADVRSIFGGAFIPPPPRIPEPPERQLIDAMLDAGIATPPETVIMDGRLHRFSTGGTKSDRKKTGWYVAYGDGIPAGRFGCWRSGIDEPWRAEVSRDMTDADRIIMARRQAEAMAARDAARQATAESVADVVARIWAGSAVADDAHPYLARKGISGHGARVTGDGRLVVPMYTADGELSSLQYISADGEKLYHAGGVTKGCMWWLGDITDAGPVYLAEGYATAASIHQATGRPCFVAYSAQNLPPVTEAIRQHRADLTIVADNDQSGVGANKAHEAAAKHGARVIVPPTPGDANDYAQAGHDLAALLTPSATDDDWTIDADEFAAQPAPIAWMIKRWIQSRALIMVHGPSGGGKTFAVLDMLMRIATAPAVQSGTGAVHGGTVPDAPSTDAAAEAASINTNPPGIPDSSPPTWMGQRVRPGRVLYLAGEGHHGMRGRIAAWKQHHGSTGKTRMRVSRSGCDLNTPEGMERVRRAIRAHGEPPDVIAVDTLHRFLLGDENSAQDAKTMLDACAQLMAEFGCTVILVHHTGVSDEAQHRARGSSAWRAALDIEISVVPPKSDGEPIQIVQRKSKDAEIAPDVLAELRRVEIDGWIDEDGEQVSSAVLVASSVPPKTGKPSKAEANRQTFEAAMAEHGGTHDGYPYLSRVELARYIAAQGGISEDSALAYTKPSGRFIEPLLKSGYIASARDGYIVIRAGDSSAINILGRAVQCGK